MSNDPESGFYAAGDVADEQPEPPKRQEQTAMENNMNPNFQDILGSAALLGGGLFGGRGGFGGQGGAYAGGRASVVDEAAVHTFKQPSSAEIHAAMAAQEQRTSSLQRDIGEIGRDLTGLIGGIQRDLLLHGAQSQAATERSLNTLGRELADCCCETQKGQLKGFAGIDKSMCDQTHVLSAQITAGNQAILNRMCDSDLAAANLRAATAENALGNAQQTNDLLDKLRCCDPCNGNGNGGGHKSSSMGATEIINVVQQTMAAMLAANGGFTPPGQGGK